MTTQTRRTGKRAPRPAHDRATPAQLRAMQVALTDARLTSDERDILSEAVSTSSFAAFYRHPALDIVRKLGIAVS